MTWTITKRYINPPDWNENIEDSRVKTLDVIINGVSNAGDELSDEVFVDISNLKTIRGYPVVRTTVQEMQWSCTGLTSLQLSFDRDPNEIFSVLSGDNFLKAHISDTGEPLDGTGDIVATTTGSAANDSFFLRMKIRLKDNPQGTS